MSEYALDQQGIQDTSAQVAAEIASATEAAAGVSEPAETPAPPAETGEAEQATEKPAEAADQDQAQADAAPQQGGRTVPLDALTSERAKRQEAQRETQELRERMARLEGRVDATAKPADQEADAAAAELEKYYDDPVGYNRKLAADAVAADREKTIDARVNRSEIALGKKHEDAREVLGEFVQFAEENQAAGQQVVSAMRSADDPAKYVYDFMQNRKAAATVGATSLEDMKAKIRVEERAKIEAELRGAKADAAAAQATQSNAGARAAGGKVPAEADPGGVTYALDR